MAPRREASPRGPREAGGTCRTEPLRPTGPLYYVCEQGAGITRERTPEGFIYRLPSGRAVRNKTTLERIRGLAVPPAWRDVWICADPDGHLQATGRDSRGRKQYKYHQAWRDLRDAGKFERMAAFGRALPEIRRRAGADLARPELSKNKVLGLVALLLDETLLRVGNEVYARSNQAYGLTTLRDRHASIDGPTLRLVFRGKGGKPQVAGVNNRRLARAVKRTQELPGDILFQYLDEDGVPSPITSGDVNEYLRDIAGEEFSAKDFRTWGGTLAAARALAASPEPPETKRELTARVNEAIDSAATHLGNTRAVARRSYVHPGVIASYVEGTLADIWDRFSSAAHSDEPADAGLTADEQALLAALDKLEPA